MTDAAITGVGLLTPAGDGREDNWRRVCAGEPAAGLHRSAHGTFVVGRVPEFDPARLGGARRWKPDRAGQFALLAAREALDDAGLDPADWDGARVAVLVGSGTAGAETYEHYLPLLDTAPDDVPPLALPSSLANSPAALVSMAFGARGTSAVVNTACASGATALAMACDMLALDRCDIVLVGGTEAGLTPYHLRGFDRLGALSRRYEDPLGASRPFDAHRDGFLIAEGAGFLVLERPGHAAARGARVKARIVGHGSASDAHHAVAPHPQGTGIAAAVDDALRNAGLHRRDIQHVNAHGTSTPRGDAIESAALARAFAHRPSVTSTKGVTGHLMGAAGAVEAALTALSLQNGVVPPTANLTTPGPGIEVDVSGTGRTARLDAALSLSVGFGGHNVALVLAAA